MPSNTFLSPKAVPDLETQENLSQEKLLGTEKCHSSSSSPALQVPLICRIFCRYCTRFAFLRRRNVIKRQQRNRSQGAVSSKLLGSMSIMCINFRTWTSCMVFLSVQTGETSPHYYGFLCFPSSQPKYESLAGLRPLACLREELELQSKSERSRSDTCE